MAIYEYNILDFLNDKANIKKLTVEINDSSIVTPLEGITVNDYAAYFDFESDLSTEDENALSAIVSAHDGEPLPPSSLSLFLDANAEVVITTPSASISGPFHLMQTLVNRRELFNDEENPIYDSTLTPILGSGGVLEDHNVKINNLENIHDKLGWHNQLITKSSYKKPDSLLIYYGWLNSFNSAVNGWNNEKVSQDMAKYNIVVFGDGVQDSGHGDYSNTQVIIARIKELNPSTKIFGYVSTNQSLANFQSKVDDWEVLQIHGIFMDESGYDFGSVDTNGRSAFNTKVDYVHSNTYANLCFVNSWNVDHIIGTENDVSYPNSTWNSSLEESNLTYDDYYLLESFAVNTVSYGNDYESKSDWLLRGERACLHRYNYGINLVGSCVIEDGHVDSSNLFDFAFISAMMFSLEAFGSSDQNYGASSAKTEFLTRPDISGLGEVYSLSSLVQEDGGDEDIYYRYVQFGKLSLDFSTSAQSSSIEKY
jgi:hypothetical protein